ncbi:MAG: hypothetical protein DMG70_08255 [Acidobacteria bacterium]|nr:MAG: hypothetical protein DMG70_08255 [Acidobacteriota bacterium]
MGHLHVGSWLRALALSIRDWEEARGIPTRPRVSKQPEPRRQVYACMEDSGEFKNWFSEVFWPGREKVVYLIGSGTIHMDRNKWLGAIATASD